MTEFLTVALNERHVSFYHLTPMTPEFYLIYFIYFLLYLPIGGYFMKNQWNPKVTRIPHKLKSSEYHFNLEIIAALVYDYICQFQEIKSQSDQASSIGLKNHLTRCVSTPERTGSDD